MSEFIIGAGTAVWLGILTSISPCPLATNIAAISYIGKRVGSPRSVLSSGLLYTLGRALVYIALGVLLVQSLLSAPQISHWLQKYMIKILGPLLVLVGMVLLGLIGGGMTGPGVADGARERADRMGIWGAGFLGIVFALAFCPVSAALFFGSLVPLAVASGSGLLHPALYGIGTALPVVVFSVLLASGAGYLGSVFGRVARFELWARRITGIIFIGTGIYFILEYVFHLP
jgi:cytochrome c-type biogenesis protein